MKLAAGKSSTQASSLLWAPVPGLLDSQAGRTPNPGALSGPWGTSRCLQTLAGKQHLKPCMGGAG